MAQPGKPNPQERNAEVQRIDREIEALRVQIEQAGPDADTGELEDRVEQLLENRTSAVEEHKTAMKDWVKGRKDARGQRGRGQGGGQQ